MKRRQVASRQRGFTMIEMLVVLVFVVLMMVLALPNLMAAIRQGKMRGAATETATLMRLARLEAIKQSCRTIVRILPATVDIKVDRVESVIDCDGDGKQDVDKTPLGTFPLPPRIRFLAPGNLKNAASVSGLSADPAGGAANVAIFQSNGSISETGGFRLGDVYGNFLEVWVEPAATARVEVHKCRVCTSAAPSADWQANGKDGQTWTWK